MMPFLIKDGSGKTINLDYDAYINFKRKIAERGRFVAISLFGRWIQINFSKRGISFLKL